MLRVETAALEEVSIEGEEELIEEASAAPLAIAAIAGRVGGIAIGQAVPGGIMTNLPEDGIQYRTGINGGTTTNFHIWERGVTGDEGLEDAPLLVGEVHGVDEVLSAN